MAVHLYTRDIIRQTAQTLWAHKLRSFLPMFGITWGVMSLLLLGSVGEGFRIVQRRQLSRLGTDLVFVFGGRVSSVSGGGQTDHWVTLTIADCDAVVRLCPAVRACTPVLSKGNIRAEGDTNNVSFQVAGILPNYQQIRFNPLGDGRPLNEQDVAEARRVVVLGDEVRKQLFPYKRAVGQQVRLNQVLFEVVGTLAHIGREGTVGVNARMMIPLETMRRTFPHPKEDVYPGAISNFIVQPVTTARHAEALRQVRALIAKRHGFDPDDQTAVEAWNTIENFNRINAIFDAMDYFLGAVGIVTLALGAIGVMNIMLVSVNERTCEIGVRKALGARRRHILAQFLAEALLITFAGGLLGMLLAYGVTSALGPLPLWSAIYGESAKEGDIVLHIAWPTLAVSMAIPAVVGLIAGMWPAIRASRLDPVEALHYTLHPLLISSDLAHKPPNPERPSSGDQ